MTETINPNAHTHDLAFLDGGRGVYCVAAGCGFRLTGDNLLLVLRSACRRHPLPATEVKMSIVANRMAADAEQWEAMYSVVRSERDTARAEAQRLQGGLEQAATRVRVMGDALQDSLETPGTVGTMLVSTAEWDGCHAEVARLREGLERLWGDDGHPHESGDTCLSCERLATDWGFPYCNQCLLEHQLEFANETADLLLEESKRAETETNQPIGLESLQAQVGDLYAERGFNAGAQTLLLGATEEIGELAMALLLTECDDFKPSAKKMSPAWADARDPAREVGDCITYLLALCNRLGVKPTFKWQRPGESVGAPQKGPGRTPDRHTPAPEHLLRPTPKTEQAAQDEGLTIREEVEWSHHVHGLYAEALQAHRAAVDEHTRLRAHMLAKYGPPGFSMRECLRREGERKGDGRGDQEDEARRIDGQ